MPSLDSYSCCNSYIGVDSHAPYNSPQHSNRLRSSTVVTQEHEAHFQKLLQKCDSVYPACDRMVVCPAASFKTPLLTLTGYFIYNRINKGDKFVFSRYIPPLLWGKSGHLQTALYGKLGRVSSPNPSGVRMYLPMVDGATATFDLFEPTGNHQTGGDFS